ncbi:MAG: phosphoribosyltransferase family protein [Kiritimatiellia bacterium]
MKSESLFNDRTDAGSALAGQLRSHAEKSSLVLGIPRGGVEVGYRVAKDLDLQFSIIMVRKLPFPDNPEAGFGAIAEDGSVYMHPLAGVPKSTADGVAREQRAEVSRRISALRQGRSLPDLKDRHVILVDDGIAMGSTTQAALMCCRGNKAARVTVAAPVASPDARAALEETADDVVVVLKPSFFRAVADYYRHWYDVPDAEVIDIMSEADSAGLLAKPGEDEAPRRAGRLGRDLGPGAGACIRS